MPVAIKSLRRPRDFAITPVSSYRLPCGPPHTLDTSGTERNQTAVCHGETRLVNRLLRSGTQRTHSEEFTVTRSNLTVNDDGIAKKSECELEPSIYLPTDFEFAGCLSGFEYLCFWRLFSLSRLFGKENE